MRLSAWLLAVFCLFTAAQACSAERSFTILHTNDWQSRLLGVGPSNEYSPASTGDDDTVGGVARLATLLEQRRAAAGEQPVLLLDGGDFSMGTLFHTVTREIGGELRLMSELSYDAATLGNHEFDFRSAGLAAMISSAHTLKGDALMPLLSSNLGFDPQRSEDDSRVVPLCRAAAVGREPGAVGGCAADSLVAASPPRLIKPAAACSL